MTNREHWFDRAEAVCERASDFAWAWGGWILLAISMPIAVVFGAMWLADQLGPYVKWIGL